jgi:hypothetical protein
MRANISMRSGFNAQFYDKKSEHTQRRICRPQVAVVEWLARGNNVLFARH